MSQPLHVGMIAPPWAQVPPDGYGGIEQVIAGLVDGLEHCNIEVTLVCAGASNTAATTVKQPWQDRPIVKDDGAFLEALWAVESTAAVADPSIRVVHDHTLVGPLTWASRRVPTIVTVHNAVHARYGQLLRKIPQVKLISISQKQQQLAPDLAWFRNIANGLPIESFPFSSQKSDYVAFLGRIVPEKGPHIAMDAAREAGKRICVSGPVRSAADGLFFASEIKPRLNDWSAVWLGETSWAQKTELLKFAQALLVPSLWEEPFGLVAIEALACGTPVVALRTGALPEIIDHGKTGYLADSVEELQSYLGRISNIDPGECRRQARERFSHFSMAEKYADVYRQFADPF